MGLPLPSTLNFQLTLNYKLLTLNYNMLSVFSDESYMKQAYQEAVLHCTLDYEKLQRFRQKFPLGPDWDSFEINIK